MDDGMRQAMILISGALSDPRPLFGPLRRVLDDSTTPSC